MAGCLLGIARHGAPRGAMETLDAVSITVEGGLEGDHRGWRRGEKSHRQVSLIERADWDAAMAELGTALDWSARRANLLVDGIDLPQVAGTVIRIGADVRLESTVECDPCSRMEEIAPGLKAALTPGWRAGILSRVLAGGDIRVGDEIRIEGSE